MKKILQKTTILLIIFIFIFPAIFNFNKKIAFAAGESYYYEYGLKLTDGTYSTSPSQNFTTSEECEVARKKIADNPNYNPNTSKISPACLTKGEAIVYVTPGANTGTTPSSVYNLLAPIGTFKVAPDNIGDYFNTIFLIAIGLCGALAVIMIVIGGIQYMGDESIFGKTEAKSRITSAILGLLIALGAFALLNTINPALLGGNINIKQVSAAIDDTPILVESSTPATGVAVGTKGLCPGGLGNVVVGGATLMHTCVSISTQVTNMITLALSQGIKLSGSSYRSNADQMALRVKNCADALTTPSGQCKPPTAIAGNSKHESGLAIDFKCNGTIIQTTDNACFLWLQTNAKNYGLKNYQPEPWHWST